MGTQPEKTWHSGKHTLEFFPPDYLKQTVVGELNGAEAQWTIDVCREVTASHGKPYVLVNMDSGGGANGEARKILGAATPYVACALVGGGAVMRAVARVVTLAISTLSSADAVPTDFFKTEAEGLAWLEEQRKLKKAAPAKV